MMMMKKKKCCSLFLAHRDTKSTWLALWWAAEREREARLCAEIYIRNNKMISRLRLPVCVIFMNEIYFFFKSKKNSRTPRATQFYLFYTRYDWAVVHGLLFFFGWGRSVWVLFLGWKKYLRNKNLFFSLCRLFFSVNDLLLLIKSAAALSWQTHYSQLIINSQKCLISLHRLEGKIECEISCISVCCFGCCD